MSTYGALTSIRRNERIVHALYCAECYEEVVALGTELRDSMNGIEVKLNAMLEEIQNGQA